MRAFLRQGLIGACQISIAYEIVQRFHISTAQGDSMKPTINNGDLLVILSLPSFFSFSKIKDQDIVVAKGYTNKDQTVCKRVYLNKDPERKHLVWLEGDNKQNSFDSWVYGFVHNDFILGKVLYVHKRRKQGEK